MVTYSPPVRALLVEDDEADALLVQERLTNFAPGEFVLDRVGTLQSGIDLAGSRAYSAVVLDLHLPDWSGPSVWREFQANAPAVPLLVLTGEEDGFIEAQAVKEGVQEFLLKSDTTGNGLVRALRHAIARESRVANLRWQRLELMASEARMRNLVVTSAEGLVVIDRGGKVLFINERAARWAGLPIDEAGGKEFPLAIPGDVTQHIGVAVDDVAGPATAGLQRVRLATIELRGVPSLWGGEPVTVVSMRDVTRQNSETTRLSVMTQLDRAIATECGDVAAVCETVADSLPRLVPYQQLEIAVSRVSGAPAEVIVRRGTIDHIDGRSASNDWSAESTASVPLGDERCPRGWIAVSSRRENLFDHSTIEVLRHVAAIVTASLGLATGLRPGPVS